MPDSAPAEPPSFHFVFGLKPQTEAFHLMHYLCLRSCRGVYPASKIHLHYRHLPFGPWWDKIAAELILHQVDKKTVGFEPARYQDSGEGRFIASAGLSYAHEADFIRLQALLDHGGVYADMDTLFVRPYPNVLHQYECVLGEETAMMDLQTGITRPSLCNAVIIAQPGARFLSDWLITARKTFDGTWSRHSCQTASLLWAHTPAHLHVVPWWWFYGFPANAQGLKSLFEENAPVPDGLCSIHLWAHLWWSPERTDFSAFHEGMLDESYVRRASTTFAKLALPFLDSSQSGANE